MYITKIDQCYNKHHLVSVFMTLQNQASPLLFAFVGFLTAVTVGVLIGILVFEDSLVETGITAGGIGLGVGISLYAVQSAQE